MQLGYDNAAGICAGGAGGAMDMQAGGRFDPPSMTRSQELTFQWLYRLGGGSLSIPPLPGVGFGVMSGSGYTVSGQIATPTGKKCGCP